MKNDPERCAKECISEISLDPELTPGQIITKLRSIEEYLTRHIDFTLENTRDA